MTNIQFAVEYIFFPSFDFIKFNVYSCLILNDLPYGVFFAGIFLFLWKRGQVIRRSICLVGLCESGKTLLFTQLIYKKAMDSFTSLKENVGVLDVPNKVNSIGFSHFIMRIRKLINIDTFNIGNPEDCRHPGTRTR